MYNQSSASRGSLQIKNELTHVCVGAFPEVITAGPSLWQVLHHDGAEVLRHFPGIPSSGSVLDLQADFHGAGRRATEAPLEKPVEG